MAKSIDLTKGIARLNEIEDKEVFRNVTKIYTGCLRGAMVLKFARFLPKKWRDEISGMILDIDHACQSLIDNEIKRQK